MQPRSELPTADLNASSLLPQLLTGGFPASAAGNSARGTVPFARAGAGAELAVGEGAAERHAHRAAAADGARDRRPRGRHLTIAHRHRVARLRLARAGLGDESHLPEPVIGGLGGSR